MRLIPTRNGAVFGAIVALVAVVGQPREMAARQAEAPPRATTPPGATPPPARVPDPPQQRVGGFVPGQKRPPEDQAQVARGKTLFEINCRGCHGPDLRGGDLGGPNLLRSQVALSDRNGELIVPIIHGSRKDMGMPAIGINDVDANAVAAYVRSVISMIGQQGVPPSAGREPPSVLLGNATAGKMYFAAKCASCHSATGDMREFVMQIPDPKTMQTSWVEGATRGERRNAGNEPGPRTVMATLTLATGENVKGQLLQIDDFLVTLRLADGNTRTFRRNGDVPGVAIQDPMQRHRDLLAEYTDKDIHDVTAYLVTLK